MIKYVIYVVICFSLNTFLKACMHDDTSLYGSGDPFNEAKLFQECDLLVPIPAECEFTMGLRVYECTNSHSYLTYV